MFIAGYPHAFLSGEGSAGFSAEMLGGLLADRLSTFPTASIFMSDAFLILTSSVWFVDSFFLSFYFLLLSFFDFSTYYILASIVSWFILPSVAVYFYDLADFLRFFVLISA